MRGLINLGAFVEQTRRDGDLLEIDRPASPHLEIAAVARATDGGPAVLFRNVVGHPGRTVLTNVFGDRRRIARMCGVHPDYLPRHLVKPGMTGWAQVNGLRGDSSIARRIQHDIYYIENWSVWLDLQIIFMTFLRWKNPAE